MSLRPARSRPTGILFSLALLGCGAGSESASEREPGSHEAADAGAADPKPLVRDLAKSQQACEERQRSTPPGEAERQPLPEQLLGVWTGSPNFFDFGLPSGSKSVHLELTAAHGKLSLGAIEDTRPLLDGSATLPRAAREGFPYTLLATEVIFDEEYAPLDKVFAFTLGLELASTEPFAPECRQEVANPSPSGACNDTCHPTQLHDWSQAEDVGDGQCLLDGEHELACDRFVLCEYACYCALEACTHDPWATLELTARFDQAQELLYLSLPPGWVQDAAAPSLGPNGEPWVELSRR